MVFATSLLTYVQRHADADEDEDDDDDDDDDDDAASDAAAVDDDDCSTPSENLARFGSATQSSQYGSAVPQNAINPPISNEWGFTKCTHTSDNLSPAWWMFNISYGTVFITDITIYYRERFARRMDGFKLYISNTSNTHPSASDLCHQDPPGYPYPNITQTISCNQLGQYVIYYDDVQGPGDKGSIIELCYVSINGCKKNYWGSNCINSCTETCIDQHCYPGNGSCIWGYNIATNALVSRNPLGTKPANLATDGDKTTCSKTQGTDVWFQVDMTEIRIVTELYLTGKGCPSTQYGPLCKRTCPAKCLGPCDLDTGRCLFGCANGWIGEKCDQDHLTNGYRSSYR
ncbi:uncharacterized protein LOC127738022 [Mytilus californianus]|uniref:uncharacterized protein LOC127738022 n=1 Tax=Mytilus californianus TaxID=6549 RepID=UPI0022483644|nr:uncharacterized protein LOC127738022 [Mytilus californianus]